MLKNIMLIYIRSKVDIQKFRGKFGISPEEAFPNALGKLKRENLIEISDDGKIRLTEKGDPWRFNIAWEFFKDFRNTVKFKVAPFSVNA